MKDKDKATIVAIMKDAAPNPGMVWVCNQTAVNVYVLVGEPEKVGLWKRIKAIFTGHYPFTIRVNPGYTFEGFKTF